MIYLLLTWLFAPLLILRTLFRRTRNTQGQWQRLLVVQTAKIGDFVATTPVFTALKQARPEAHVAALLHPVNLPLAQGLGEKIDAIHLLPAQGWRAWAGKRFFWQLLRQERFDAVLVLSPNMNTFLVPLWAGLPWRVSVLPDRRQGSARWAWPLLSHGEAHQTGRLFRETALRALAGLGIRLSPALLTLPNQVGLSQEIAAKGRLDVLNLPQPIFGLGLGAGNRMKAMNAAQIAQLTRLLLTQTAGSVVLIGTSADQAAAQTLLATLSPNEQARVKDSTGQWSLGELPGLLAALDGFIGVDSGATYLADALGVPVIDFMGPADANDQRPLGQHAIIINSQLPCAPCSHSFDAPYQCHLGTRACIAEIAQGTQKIQIINSIQLIALHYKSTT